MILMKNHEHFECSAQCDKRTDRQIAEWTDERERASGRTDGRTGEWEVIEFTRALSPGHKYG